MDLVSERTTSLEASVRELERVGHVAAHELQGPLWTIVGDLGVIRDAVTHTTGDPERPTLLDRAEDAAARLRARIARLASGTGALPKLPAAARP